MTVELPPDYRPSPAEAYMNPRQIEYFRRRLAQTRTELLGELEANAVTDTAEDAREGDQADQASAETDRDLKTLNQGRAGLLLREVDQALARIASGSYGFCEETGEPIGLKRLEAQPAATLSVAAQTRRERRPG